MIFTITGEPRGKQRPRVTTRGGYAHAYTPTETTAYEKRIKYGYVMQGGRKIDGPIKLELWAFLQIPKSISKKRAKEMKGAPCTKKPDADNILKIVMDALNGTAYGDDKQVALAVIHKSYWLEGKLVVDIQEV